MLQITCKTLGFKKKMVYKIPPGGEVNHIQPVAYYLCFVSFPCGILYQMWYLIVSIPDLCYLYSFEMFRIFLQVRVPVSTQLFSKFTN